MADQDRIAAEHLVDYALDYVNAGPTYRALHRAEAIRKEVPFARFERRQRELRACKAIASCAVQIGRIAGVGEAMDRRAAA